MPWAAPRTWVSLERLSAALLNQHVRDNIAWLGTDSPTCILRHSVSQEITTENTETLLAFDTVVFDPAGVYEAPGKIVVPVACMGLVTAVCSFEADAEGYRDVQVRRNGGSVPVARRQTAAALTAAVETIIGPSGDPVVLAAGDELEVYVRHNAGNPLDVIGGVAYSPIFMFTWRQTV